MLKDTKRRGEASPADSRFMVSLSNHEAARTYRRCQAFMVRQAHHEGLPGPAVRHLPRNAASTPAASSLATRPCLRKRVIEKKPCSVPGKFEYVTFTPARRSFSA